MDKKLTNLRDKIDKLDERLLSLLNQRFLLVQKIGLIKIQHKVSILQNSRKKQIEKKMLARGLKLGISSQFIKKLFKIIHDQSVFIQKNIKRRKK